MHILTVRSTNRSIVQSVIRLTLWLVILMLFSACSGAREETLAATAEAVSPTATPVPTASKVMSDGPDYWPTDGWRRSTPEEQGMDSEKLAELIAYIREQELDIHSVTIVRNGYIVADGAFYPYDGRSVHNLKSATKSVISALIGIAIEQGYIAGLDQPVLSFFPDRTVANVDANKEAMTLEHLLMMATGLECRDSFRYRYGGYEQMMQSDDWVQFMLDLPMLEAPGTSFEYCNGASLLLSAIIQETSGKTAAEFADQNLFAPLGIGDVIWPATPQGVTLGYAELRLHPHDMAKIGHLFLQSGKWDGRQLIPASWVAASTANQINALGEGYGYQWWVDQDGVYSARGFGGQYIFVDPDSRLVAVFTGNLSEAEVTTPKVLLDIFVVPALISAEPLAQNPDGLALLASNIEAVGSHPTSPEPVPPLPEVASRVSGMTYLLDTPNPTGFTSVSLTFGDGDEALIKLEYLPADVFLSGDPALAPVQLEVPVGLDNVYRFSPGEFGIPMGAKGEWLAEDVFLVYFDSIGNVWLQRVEIAFHDEQITFEMWVDSLSPAALTASVAGRLDE